MEIILSNQYWLTEIVGELDELLAWDLIQIEF